jgi:hypothetical protein
MSHSISGLVGDFHTLRAFAASHELHGPARLADSLGFLPLSDEQLDILHPVQGDFDLGMTYLSSSLKKTISELSASGPMAYIETDYFGGTGTQGATVYDKGQCVMSAVTAESGPVSRALAMFGVIRLPNHLDEFESAGLNRHRNNEDWIEAVRQESTPCD